MLSPDKSFRPDCQQILKEMPEWYLNLNELKDNNEFKEIISYKNKTKSLEQCFHSFFIQKKWNSTII
jgi:hypothetical protein